jgi:hypothetical protein
MKLPMGTNERPFIHMGANMYQDVVPPLVGLNTTNDVAPGVLQSLSSLREFASKNIEPPLVDFLTGVRSRLQLAIQTTKCPDVH